MLNPETTDTFESVAHYMPRTVEAPADPLVAMIERVVMSPDMPIERLQQVLALKEQIDAKAAERAFTEAFSRACAEFPDVPMTGRGHNQLKYATMRDIVVTTRPVLARHGMALSFDTTTGDKSVTVTALLSHMAGHTRTVKIVLPADGSGSKNPVQAFGSSQTYGQRYTAQAILGLSLGEDTEDDGKSSGMKGTITEEQEGILRDLLTGTASDEAKFLRHFGVESLETFPAAKYGAADGMLRRKLKEKGAQQ